MAGIGNRGLICRYPAWKPIKIMKMIDFWEKIRYFKIRGSGRKSCASEINAVRDWKIMFFSFLALFLLFLIADIYVSWRFSTEIKPDESGPAGLSSENIELNRARLDNVLKDLDNKEKEFNNILNNPPEIPDPSRQQLQSSQELPL